MKKTTKPPAQVRAWGLASGKGRTLCAAKGSFTHRDYPADKKVPKLDWQKIIVTEPLTP